MIKKLSSYLFIGAALSVGSQAADAVLPAPVPAPQIIYRHWPEQFVQWVGPELPYSMIELYVDPSIGKQPLYDAVLTERATGKRIHYSDQPFMVEINKRMGAEAYLTKMQLDRPANAGTDANYLLRFTDHAGQPVLWQFVQGSDVSERGGGLSPAGVQPPVLMYREQSAVAGQGTALKIGNVVSAADVWKEIAQPPYFVPYHGALTENLEIAVFADGSDQWTAVESPSKLEKGAKWKLKAQDGRDVTLTVTAVGGDTAAFSEEDQRLAGQKVTFEARLANGIWSTKKVHFAPAGANAGKGLTVAFAPGVGSETGPAKFEVFSGAKTRIASGSVSIDAKNGHAAWQFKDPEWLKGKALTAAARTPARAE